MNQIPVPFAALAVLIPLGALLLGICFVLAVSCSGSPDEAVVRPVNVEDWRTIPAPRPGVECWEKGFGRKYAVVCLRVEEEPTDSTPRGSD